MAKFHSNFREQQRKIQQQQREQHRQRLKKMRQEQLQREKTVDTAAVTSGSEKISKHDDKRKIRQLKRQILKLQNKVKSKELQNLQLKQEIKKQKSNEKQKLIHKQTESQRNQQKEFDHILQEKDQVIRQQIVAKESANDKMLAMETEMQNMRFVHAQLDKLTSIKLKNKHQEQTQKTAQALIQTLHLRYIEKVGDHQLTDLEVLRLFNMEIQIQKRTAGQNKKLTLRNKELQQQIKQANTNANIANINRRIISNRFESWLNFTVEQQLHRVATSALLEELLIRISRDKLTNFDGLEQLYNNYMRRIEPAMAMDIENQEPDVRFGFIRTEDEHLVFTDVNSVEHQVVKNPHALEIVEGNAYRGRVVQDGTELVLEKALPFFKRRLQRVAHRNHRQRLSTNKVMPEVKSVLKDKHVLIATWKRNFDYKEYLRPFGIATTIVDTAEIQGDRLAELTGAKRFDLVFCDTGGMHHNQVAIMEKVVSPHKLVRFYRLNSYDLLGAILDKLGLYPQLVKYGFATGENKGYW